MQQVHSFPLCENLRNGRLDDTRAHLHSQRDRGSEANAWVHLHELLPMQPVYMSTLSTISCSKHSLAMMSDDGTSRATGFTGFAAFTDADADGVAECKWMWMIGKVCEGMVRGSTWSSTVLSRPPNLSSMGSTGLPWSRPGDTNGRLG
jgi:hypothetical protein